MKHYTSKYMLIDNVIYEDYYISVNNGKFVSVGGNKPDGLITDFGNCLIMPGMVNTHTHSMQALMRGFGDDCDLLDWLKNKVYRYCNLMDEEMVYISALLSFSEMAENGITSVVDFFYLNRSGNTYAKAVIRAAKDVGIRLVLARTMMDWENAPDCIREQVSVAERNFLSLYEEFQGQEDMVRICPAPHSAYGASADMIKLAHDFSVFLKIPCHMHVSDSLSAMTLVREMTGRDYVAYLDDLGVLDNRFIAVHCIWCDEDARKLLIQNGVMVSHNPVSNMFLGEPAAPIVELISKGTIIGLGTDGAASNNRLSIIQEMKLAALHQKSICRNAQAIKSNDIIAMATVNGNQITGFNAGRISDGHGADFVVVDLSDLALNPVKKLQSHIAYALSEKAVSRVYVAGKCLYENGSLCNVDTVKLREKANRFVSNW